jgi:hypothetical protein
MMHHNRPGRDRFRGHWRCICTELPSPHILWNSLDGRAYAFLRGAIGVCAVAGID